MHKNNTLTHLCHLALGIPIIMPHRLQHCHLIDRQVMRSILQWRASYIHIYSQNSSWLKLQDWALMTEGCVKLLWLIAAAAQKLYHIMVIVC